MILLKNNFASGELSEATQGRVDTLDYQRGAKQLTNVLVTPQGSLVKRQGTFIQHALGSPASGEMRLVSYDYDELNRYALLFTNLSVTITSPDHQGMKQTLVTPWLSGDIPNLQWLTRLDVMLIVDGNHPIHQIKRNTATTFSISEFVFSVAPQVEGILRYKSSALIPDLGADTVDIPFLALDGSNVDADRNEGLLGRIIIDVDGTFEGVVVAVANDDVTAQVTKRGVIANGATLNILGRPSTYLRPTGTLTRGGAVTLSAVVDINSNASVDRLANGQGAYVTINGGFVEIDPTQSTPQKWVGTVLRDIDSEANTAAYSVSDNAFTATNNPTAVGEYAGSLWLGGTASHGHRLWGSIIGDYSTFFTSTSPSGGVALDLSAQAAPRIKWLAGIQNALIVGCGLQEIAIRGRDGVVNILTLWQRTVSNIGSGVQQPVTTTGGVTFVSADGRRVWTYTHNYENDLFIGRDATLTSSDTVAEGIRDLQLSESPWQAIVCLLSNGTLAVGCVAEDKEIYHGWSTIKTAGNIRAFCITRGRPSDTIVMAVERFGKLYIETSSFEIRPTKDDNFLDFVNQATMGDIKVSDTADGRRVADIHTPLLDKNMASSPDFACLYGDVWLNDGLTIDDGFYTVYVDSLTGADQVDPQTIVGLGLLYDVTVDLLPLSYDRGVGNETYVDATIGGIKLKVWGSGKVITINNQQLIDRNSSEVVGESPPLYTGILEIIDGFFFENGSDIKLKERSAQPMNLTGFWVEIPE